MANTKTATKTADVFSFSAFDPAKFSESLRDFAEKGAAQSKDAYSKMKVAAEDASKTVEATLQSAQNGSVELGLKAVEALRTNAELSLSHMEALLTVKSVAEFVELQTSFIRKQAEVTVEQAKAMQEAARKVAETVSKPGKEAAEKVISTFKVA
ncbi:phasin [Rhizobium paknamense]|uniref:Phasin n=1 Tax=Rhizobium paknamense TaxID=1206817 RepID=A0ABU0IIN5_9HYPH|nr:phasin [Rhizobium paknamense]MDQ0458119.1 phasin [Rhizobium paknamense]